MSDKALEKGVSVLYAEIDRLEAEVERLKGVIDNIYSEVPCDKCRLPITPGCYGCDMLAARAQRDRLLNLLNGLLGSHPEDCACDFCEQFAAMVRTGC